MKNSDKFQEIFGLYATEVWAMPEKDFLEWLNAVYDRDNHGWHPFRQEQDPETGLWKFVDPPADWQRILVTIRSQNGENDPFVQEDVWYENGYDLLESGYTPCAEAIAWRAWPDPYVPDMEVKK